MSNPLLLKPFRPSGMSTASAASIIANEPSIRTSGPAMFFKRATNIIDMMTTQYHPFHASDMAARTKARDRRPERRKAAPRP